MAAENPIRRPWPAADILAAAVWMLAVAVRIWAAWAGRCLTNPDSSVVALMARHLAALKEFPVFFYGQAYMGSLEPMASALWVRLLGATGFAVNLGPVVFAAAALFFLWRWARDAAGPWGGLAALLAALFGPPVFFQFQTAPRGGYMVALWVDALAIYAAARMGAGLWAGHAVPLRRFAGLGLLAGIGLWSNMIVVTGLLTAALLLAGGMRGRIWRHGRGIGAGLAGFLIGFSPWWIWNLRHGWASLAMSQFGTRAAPLESLRNSWTRFLWLQDAGLPFLRTAPALMALAGLGLAALGVWLACRCWREADPRRNFARAGAVLFCAGFMAVYVVAGINTTRTARYWVPLVPGLAVLAAVACAAPGQRARPALAWCVLLGLTGVQGALSLAAIHLQAGEARPRLAAYAALGALLERAGVDALLAPIQLYPLNFALEERFAVSNGRNMFYEPVYRKAEESAAPAYASDFSGIEAFLAQHGATCQRARAGGRHILWDVHRPPAAGREIPGDRIASLTDGAGADQKTILTDRDLATVLSPAGGPDPQDAILEWHFTEAQTVQAVRLVFAHGMAAAGLPRQVRIEAQSGGEWLTLRQQMPVIPLEWSGPRIYAPAGLARLEYPLGATNVAALRIVLQETPPDRPAWRLAEATVFAPDAETPPPADLAALDALGRRLQTEDPDALVCAPRWVANQLLCRGWIGSGRLAGASGATVPAGRFLLLVMEPHLAEATQGVLQARGFHHHMASAGPWTLIVADGGKPAAAGPAVTLRWTGAELLVDRAEP